jgi:hypothetical protein
MSGLLGLALGSAMHYFAAARACLAARVSVGVGARAVDLEGMRATVAVGSCWLVGTGYLQLGLGLGWPGTWPCKRTRAGPDLYLGFACGCGHSGGLVP